MAARSWSQVAGGGAGVARTPPATAAASPASPAVATGSAPVASAEVWHTVVRSRGAGASRAGADVTADALDGDRRTYFGEARDYARKLDKPSAGKTATCYMSYTQGGELRWFSATSGPAGGDASIIMANRKDAAVVGKETCCAEEHLLAQHPSVQFLHSFTINEHGLVAACTGCMAILRKKKNIWDMKRAIGGTR